MRKKLVALALALTTAIAVLAIPALAAAPKPATVKVLDDSFMAKKVTVKKGAKITWKWSGVQPHNVTVTAGPKKFASKTQTKGSFSQVMTKPGTYKIVCTIHVGLGMKMTVIVK